MRLFTEMQAAMLCLGAFATELFLGLELERLFVGDELRARIASAQHDLALCERQRDATQDVFDALSGGSKR